MTVADDPAAPRPVGPMMQPISGVPLEVQYVNNYPIRSYLLPFYLFYILCVAITHIQSRQDWHRNLEAAIQHHSSTLGKYPAISTVDSHGKVSVACTYS